MRFGLLLCLTINIFNKWCGCYARKGGDAGYFIEFCMNVFNMLRISICVHIFVVSCFFPLVAFAGMYTCTYLISLKVYTHILSLVERTRGHSLKLHKKGWQSTRHQTNSTPRHLGPWTSRPQVNSAPQKLGPKTTRPQDISALVNSAPELYLVCKDDGRQS